MKKLITTTLWLFILWIFAITLSGCGSKSKLNNAMISREDGQMQMMEISEKLMNGEITQDEANKKMEKINSNMETQEDMVKDLYKNVSNFDWLPKWAKQLWIYELSDFDMIESKSSVTEYNKDYGMWEAISLIYTYDNEDIAVKSAKKLAASIGIKEADFSPRLLQESMDKTMESMMATMSDEEIEKYENNKMSWYMADGTIWDYYIMVSVADGEIMVLANNIAQNGTY